jgi:hypothetical protein
MLVLPEDRENAKLVTGFLMEFPSVRQIDVEPESGGWEKVLLDFTSNHIRPLKNYPNRRIILLIDFDRKSERFAEARARIPNDVADRVFILGAWKDPETLSSAGLGSREQIGRAIAADCRNNTNTIWEHELLRHNKPELDRLYPLIHEILFPSV